MLEEIIKKIYKVAIYIRLSREDVDKGFDESESITNQKSLLTNYIKKIRLRIRTRRHIHRSRIYWNKL